MLVNPTAFRFPVVHTPGDNEWTDCQKISKPSVAGARRNARMCRA